MPIRELHWGLLGSVCADIGAGPIVLAPRPAAVLCILLVDANEVVPTDRLAGALWGAEPPSAAHNSIARFVSDLRRALGPRGDRVVSASGGYRIDVRDGELDVDRATTALEEARRLIDHTPDIARAVLADGLACFRSWPNRLLADLHDVVAVVRSHDELRIGLLELDGDVQLRCGLHRDVIARLEFTVEEYPFHEQFWAQLMQALYRSGRTAEALRAYQRLVGVLGSIGIEPAPALRRLEAEMVAYGTPRPDAAPSPGPNVALGLPRSFAAVPRLPIVGRDAELEVVMKAWKDAATGTLRAILVGGEPGVGKTRLAAEAGRAAHRVGARVLLGRCDEGSGPQYQPFVEALSHVVSQAPAHQLTALLGPGASELSRVCPELRNTLPDLTPTVSDPETERFLLFEAFAGWLEAQSSTAPTLLVLDDLHWAAEPTLRLLRHVVWGERDYGLLVLATYRDTEVERGGPLAEVLADLRRLDGIDRLSLGGLDPEGIADLVDSVVTPAFGDRSRDFPVALHARTGGNPFFATEVLVSLAERGMLHSDAGEPVELDTETVWAVVPEGVRDVVGHRVDALGEGSVEVMHVAAVAGQEFELDPVVVVVADMEEEQVVTTLEAARAAGLIEEIAETPIRFRFAHSIVRQSLLDEMPAASRQRGHRALAVAIERLRAGQLDRYRPVLAMHWDGAGTEPSRAIDALIIAADAALAQSADGGALEHVRRALELVDATDASDAVRVDVLTRSGEALRRVGDASHRAVLLEAGRIAARSGDGERMAAAALANGRVWQSDTTGTDVERVAALEAALAALGPGASNTRALLLVRLAVECMYDADPARRVALCDEALATARAQGDLYTIGAVLTGRQPVLVGHATVVQRQADSQEQMAIADELDDPGMRYHSRIFAYFWHVQQCDLPGADAMLREAERIAGAARRPEWRWTVSCLDGALARLAGDRARTESLSEQSATIGAESGVPDASVFDAIMRTALLVDRADPSTFGALRVACDRVPDHYPGATLWPALLEGVISGDLSPVRSLLDGVAASTIAPWSADGGPQDAALALAATFAGVEAALGRPSQWTSTVFEYLDPWRGQLFGNIVWNGPTESYLAGIAPLAGRPELLDGLLDEALRICDAIDAPLLEMHARVLGACGLRSRGHPGDRLRAEDLAQRAIELGDRIGAGFPRFAAAHFPALGS